MDEHLQTIRVSVRAKNGETVDLDATIQDTLPHGSDVGTVVVFHGVPGSHNDFKTLRSHLQERGIRFIVTDFPGFGYTPQDERLCCDSDEAVQFADEVLKRIDPKGKLIFLGHSRGSELALRMAALNESRTNAVVLVNPIGFSAHRSVRPRWVCAFLAWLLSFGAAVRFILKPLLYFFFSKLMCMKIKNGEVAATIVRTVSVTDFPSQLRYVQQLRDSHVQVLITYGGSDPIIEQPISDHFVQQFGDIKCLNCSSRKPEQSTFDEYAKMIRCEGNKVAICFSKEGHQLQKNRATFLADAILALLNNDQKHK
ncbi:Uncharacterized protein F35H12.5 [Toxocara canis]|uniref:Uncharacterized protein F35H12.5 n=1 Tax=Toxocara canis TaxID=6265 RepID=A0A0B2UX92_TOXCA|nr:Uncharacterized protein F35H12.5 [Toxocara canis]